MDETWREYHSMMREKYMYRVYRVKGGFQIFYCPSAPRHYNDKVPYDGKVYTKQQAAYRKIAHIRKALAATSDEVKRHVHIV
jgi:hypothetical protein